MAGCTLTHLLSLLALMQWSSLAEASHFRHGSISWAPTDSNGNTIRFTFRLAFRRSFSNSYYCDENTVSQGYIIGSGGSWNAKCTNPFHPVCFYSIHAADTGFRCTDFSRNQDWSMGENNFTYTLPSSNLEWIVSYGGCCWISNLVKYANSGWLVSTNINISRRSDNGKINSSPVSKSPAIVRFQNGCQKSLRVPVEDPDGDFVKCRWANRSESSIPGDSCPYTVLDETNCILTYRGNGTVGTYVVTLTLEDFPAGTTNFNNIRPFSAVPLQFLVIISSGSGSCDDIPVFTVSTPQDGECSEVQIGSAYRAVIEVRLANFAKHVVEITTSSPSGMQLTSLRYHGGIYYRNVTWYPNQYQIGQQLFCFQALDSSGLQSEWRCVTILVGLSNTPHVILGTQWPINPISEVGPGLIVWGIRFDRVIKKPRSSSYIRLVLQSSSHTIFKVDTLSQYVIIDSNLTVLYFAMPKAALSMNGSYAILIDHGAVVGQGCSYDGPPTPGITSPRDWGFTVDGVCPVGYALSPPSFTNCVDINECGGHKRSIYPIYPSATYTVHGIHPTPASSMPSSVNVLPDPSQFEFHLPSECDHTCHNTLGSYRCSCVSGYRLAADGKSCSDVDECSTYNGGCSHHCFNVPGSFYCGCPEGTSMGANNLTCVEPGVSVDCGASNMTVSLEKKTFPFFDAARLHLRYSSCRATQNATHLLISTPLNGCGTQINETQDALIFWNEIKADVVIIDYVITRTHDIKLPFYCSYSRKKMLSLSFKPQHLHFGTEAGYGNFTFKMDFYKSSSFATPYAEQDYPLKVALNDKLYVRLSVESSADLVIMVVSCKSTKDESSFSWPRYSIIENGCPRDTTMEYRYDPARSYQQFQVGVFRFIGGYDKVHFHCEVLACHKYSPNSRCSKGCERNNKRKRRDVTRDEIEHDESTTKVTLTRGPLIIQDEKQKSGETGQNKQQTALIGGVAGAGGVGLIAVIALAVLFVKYRIARRFMNRNKVGDMYTTQDEQLSRRNAYVQPEDMVEQEDGM